MRLHETTTIPAERPRTYLKMGPFKGQYPSSPSPFPPAPLSPKCLQKQALQKPSSKAGSLKALSESSPKAGLHLI